MNNFFSKELGMKVVTRKGDEVSLPDDNALVSVTYFEGANVFEVVSDGIRRSGQLLCVRTESVIGAFSELETPPVKSQKSKTSASTTGENYPQNFEATVEPLDAEAVTNSETAPKTRSYKSLHRGWKNVRDKFLNVAEPENTVLLTLTLSGKVGFERMSKLLTAFIRVLRSAFPTLEACGAFFEPDSDGLGWHVHLFAYFCAGIPDELEKFAREWWAEQEDIPTVCNDFQVTFRYFANAEQLIRALDYCNPTKGKKKRTMYLYPFGRQAARYYGKVSKPRAVTAPFRLVAELVSEEILSLRHSTEFSDPVSGEVIYSRTRVIFKVRESFLSRLHEHRNADFEDMIFLADECSLCCRGQPHEYLSRFCANCALNSA